MGRLGTKLDEKTVNSNSILFILYICGGTSLMLLFACLVCWRSEWLKQARHKIQEWRKRKSKVQLRKKFQILAHRTSEEFEITENMTDSPYDFVSLRASPVQPTFERFDKSPRRPLSVATLKEDPSTPSLLGSLEVSAVHDSVNQILIVTINRLMNLPERHQLDYFEEKKIIIIVRLLRSKVVESLNTPPIAFLRSQNVSQCLLFKLSDSVSFETNSWVLFSIYCTNECNISYPLGFKKKSLQDIFTTLETTHCMHLQSLSEIHHNSGDYNYGNHIGGIHLGMEYLSHSSQLRVGILSLFGSHGDTLFTSREMNNRLTTKFYFLVQLWNKNTMCNEQRSSIYQGASPANLPSELPSPSEVITSHWVTFHVRSMQLKTGFYHLVIYLIQRHSLFQEILQPQYSDTPFDSFNSSHPTTPIESAHGFTMLSRVTEEEDDDSILGRGSSMTKQMSMVRLSETSSSGSVAHQDVVSGCIHLGPSRYMHSDSITHQHWQEIIRNPHITSYKRHLFTSPEQLRW